MLYVVWQKCKGNGEFRKLLCIKPATATHMQQNLLTAYRKVMEGLGGSKPVWTQIFTIVWRQIILVKIQMDNCSQDSPLTVYPV